MLSPSLSLSMGADGRLLVNCFAGCGFAGIMAALHRQGLLGGNFHAPSSDVQRSLKVQIKPDKTREKLRGRARQVWQESRPIIGTIAEKYLRGRAISCALPESLRFHPNCMHGPSQLSFPAMVARIDGTDELAITRTWLRSDGSAKADIRPPRAMLGACKGGAVRLLETGDHLVVAEGIETALSLAGGLKTGPMRLWAALSTSGLINLNLPDIPSLLTIATDGDQAGQSAGDALAKRARALGWEVKLLPAPQGRDWNDILKLKDKAK